MVANIILIVYASTFIFSSPQSDITEGNNTSNMAKGRDERAVSLESNEFENSRWFWFVSLMNPYLNLEEKERPVKELFDPIMSFIAPEQKPVKTVNDYQDDFLIWAPYVGLGYQINRKWAVTVQGGGEGGILRTKQTHLSILLVPLHTDFEIQCGDLYCGTSAYYSPWGSPEHRKFNNWKERLKSARPYISMSLVFTHLTYDAKVKAKLLPLLPIVDLNPSETWHTVNLDTNVGFEIPLNERDEILFSFGGSVAPISEDNDFSFSIQFKRFLHKKKQNK
ncbi:MAG TPA: hypothetical protein PLX23_11800 [Candidatus Hydrogenedens sp.]|nr:hypothetical protein [Candidatus Hydrogenedens sp.]